MSEEQNYDETDVESHHHRPGENDQTMDDDDADVEAHILREP